MAIYSGSPRAQERNARQVENCPQNCPQMEVLRGRDGRDGRDGESGSVGLPGQKGEQGVPGAQGGSVRGEKGERGISGPQGPIGISGPQGAMGEKGEQGSPGLIGPQGFRGLTGPEGEKGSGGARGFQGPEGQKGEPVPGQPGFQGAVGQKGKQGERGAQGPPTGGAIYTRWGRTSCPSDQGTELVYSGRAGGSWWSKAGGAANYLCMPDDPDYLLFASGNQGLNYVYGVEYTPMSNQPFWQPNVYAHNAPCAVCFTTSRDTVMMIPAKTQCPTSWTREYIGYLMSQSQSHIHPTMYECVDKDPESVPGLNTSNWSTGSAIFVHVEASCNGMDCSRYDTEKELTCVVCTR